MTDFTPEQAKQWVAQEIAKHTTPQSIAKRIASERQMLAIVRSDTLPDMPNSEWAHEELLRQLQHLTKGA